MPLDSIRVHMHRQLLLPARVGAQLGVVSEQVLALHRGDPVTLHRDQLNMFGAHPDEPDLGASEWWQLTGDNELVPTTPP
jgi:hypothetical protein